MAMTTAEKQASYRAKRRELGEKKLAVFLPAPVACKLAALATRHHLSRREMLITIIMKS